jgi:eukaryotic-like serine/threonine-protein kinase
MTEIVSTLTQHLAGHYRVERELGAGGMATVYLAHDLKHDRDVAIKVLHPDLGAALGGERFLAEIRTTARLQHPHILPLLDSGEAGGLLYYVMPLVTGETLRARLERERQLPIQDAVRIAREVADALGYAHGLGVIHRDIKPENILLQNGHALVADFGIALAVQSAGGHRLTQTGLSLGTPQYMSPEQAMGERTIDARSDLYALGAVTYEMLVGEAPFTGPSVQAIVARVMTEEPRPLHTQRKAIPEPVEDAVMRALEKLPADRWATARELAEALDGTSTAATSRGATTRSTRGVQRRAPLSARLRDPLVLSLAAVALVASLVASLVAGFTRRPAPVAEQLPVRFAIPASRNGSSTALGLSDLAISRDGRLLVYVGRISGGRNGLLIRPIDDVQPRALPGTEGADSPFFSPDGKWVAFIRGNRIYKTAIEGGTPQVLAVAPGTFNGASWSTSGVIVTSGNLALYTITETGGAVRELSKAKKSTGEMYQLVPIVVDDAKAMVYSSWSNASAADAKLAIASLETGKTTVLDVFGLAPLGVIDGTLLYVTASGAIMAVPIDVEERRVEGTPVQVASGVSINATTGLARASLSSNGTLFYASGAQVSQTVLADMHGATQVVLGEPREYAFPRYSPDGSTLAMTIGTAEQRDIWLYDVSSGASTRLTTQGRTNERAEWTPDGKRVLYRTDRGGLSTIWARPADLSTDAQPLLTREALIFEAVISPDGRNIAYQLDTAGADLYYSALQGDTTPKPVATSRAIESMARISPDGRWITFVTDESGTNQVVVQPFPGPGARVQLSTSGGSEPVWSRDGARVFYRGDGAIMAARLRMSPTLGVLGRDSLFVDDFVHATNPHANFDVSPDGSRLLLLKAVNEEQMIVVANWGAGLRAKISKKPGT